MMYAFSRDGALPGHTFFHKVDQKRKSPIRTGTLHLKPRFTPSNKKTSGVHSLARMHLELHPRPPQPR